MIDYHFCPRICFGCGCLCTFRKRVRHYLRGHWSWR